MTATAFIDSNIWVYYHAMKPDEKFAVAKALIDSNFTSLVVSTQILGELYHVLVRKKMASQANAGQIILDLVSEFIVVSIETSQVAKAIEINNRYGYSYWDSLIVATALQSNCNILYSEDMQNGQLIEDRLRIINPFILES
jgi:predicted nucleic acid-binding protein